MSSLRLVWNTRPAERDVPLDAELAELALAWLHLPLLELQPEPRLPFEPQLALPDRVVFVSPTAASLGLAYLQQLWPTWPASVEFFAVGAASAEPVQRAGLVCRFPHSGASEALLAEPEWQHCAELRVWIMRGDQGRELLAEQLRARGASVRYFGLYRRQCPLLSPQQLAACVECWPNVVAIWLTSAAALQHLQQIFEPVIGALLWQKPLLVVSLRLQHLALQLGFQRVLLLAGPSPADLLAGLRQL